MRVAERKEALTKKKIKLIRKDNEELKTIVDKQNQSDIAVLLNSKELSDANSKLETAITELENRMNHPAEASGPDVITVGNITVNEET